MSLGLGISRLGLSTALAGGAFTPTPPFLFSDTFGGATAGDLLVRRPGWRQFTRDTRSQTLVTLDGAGAARTNEGYGIVPLNGIDLGRHEFWIEVDYAGGNSSQVRVIHLGGGSGGTNDAFSFRVNTATAYRTELTAYRGDGTSSTIYDSTGTGVGVSGPCTLRLEYRLSSDKTSAEITLLQNGAVPPWTGIAAGGKYTVPVSTVRALSCAGFSSGSSGVPLWQAFRAGHFGDVALPMLTLDYTPAVQQAGRLTDTKSIKLSGIATDVDGIRFRLLQNRVVVSGWDWGQKALSNVVIADGRWSAMTPEIPRGQGYEIEVEATNDPMAGGRTNVFHIGNVTADTGQSNDTALALANWSTSGVAGAYVYNGITEGPDGNCRLDAFTVATGPVLLDSNQGGAYAATAATFDPDHDAWGVLALGKGSTLLAQHLPGADPVYNTGESLWDVMARQIAFVGGDVCMVTIGQGEQDAGRTLTGNSFDAAREATYRANLIIFRDALRTLTGRSTLKVGIVGLGRYNSGPGGAVNPSDPSYDRFRRMQWDICEGPGAVEGFFWLGTKLDLNHSMVGSNPDPDHMDSSTMGSPAIGRRRGAGVLKALGKIDWDKSGLRYLSAAADGNDVVLEINPNGAASITVPAVPDNLIFSASSDFSTLLTPSNGRVIDPTHIAFTLPQAAAGVWIKSPNGANPKTGQTDAIIKSVYSDGDTAIACPMFIPMQAA